MGSEMCIRDRLWSDPDEIEGEWAYSPRGAGKIYGKLVTDRVLKILNTKIIVRAHEPCNHGFKLNHDGKVLTLFSLKGYPYLNAEAAVLLGAHPFKIINIILFGLVKKGRIRILQWSPVKVEILPTREEQKTYHCPNCGAPMKGESEIEYCEYCGCEVVLEGKTFYYENQFLLKGIKEDGTLDVDGVKIVLKSLSRNVDRKMKGYCRRDTEKYYKEKIEKKE